MLGVIQRRSAAQCDSAQWAARKDKFSGKRVYTDFRLCTWQQEIEGVRGQGLKKWVAGKSERRGGGSKRR